MSLYLNLSYSSHVIKRIPFLHHEMLDSCTHSFSPYTFFLRIGIVVFLNIKDMRETSVKILVNILEYV